MSYLKKSPLIIGHRGASALAPENTIAAFVRAFDDGADGIELDVRLSRDGVPVVIHDPDLRHTGLRRGRIAKLSSQRLAQIDVGSWFNRSHRQLARLKFTVQTVPTLDEVFNLMNRHPRQNLVVYVELKTVRQKKMNAKLAAAVVDLINRHGFQSRTIVISFNLPAVTEVKRLDPAIQTGALFGPKQRATKSIRKMIAATLACGAKQILLHHLIANERILKLAREAGLSSVVWTIDDPRWLERARKNGIHALMTNNPARMI